MQEIVLRGEELGTILRAAAEHKVPLGLTFRYRNRWVTLRTRLLAIQKDRLLVEPPLAPAREPSRPLPYDNEVGCSFRLDAFRYSFISVVGEQARCATDEGLRLTVALRRPDEIHRMERRFHPRAEAPGARRARVSFWPGGRAAEPDGACPDRPVWCGNMVDLSLGGFAVRTSLDARDLLEVGDIVGARLAFSDCPVALYVNAQLRRATREGPMCVLGFEFVGLTQSEEGRSALAAITERVKQYAPPAEGG